MIIFHASQNAEEMFEVLLPGLTGTDWELVSTLTLLVVGIIIGVVVWHSSRGNEATVSEAD